MKSCRMVLALAMILLFSGCASKVMWVELGYKTPGSSGVALKKDATIKLIGSGEKQLATATLQRIAQELAKHKNGGVKVISDANTPSDYYVLMNMSASHKVAPKESVPFNARKIRQEQDGKSGGKDIIAKIEGTPDVSGAMQVSVAIYSTAGLEPVHYFELALYDGDFRTENGKVRGNEQFVRDFTWQVGKAFADMFVSDSRSIKTAIPKENADSVMVQALKAGSLQDAEARAHSLIPDRFDDFIAKVKGVGEKERKQFDSALCSYYLLAIARELGNYDIENLRTLHSQYSQILLFTQNAGLAEACANSLARIEKKAELTGNKL
ncbi:MAG: hypothetical protein J6X55_08565 [Victivallales bacterium]|nr:hypothetical protein [Victivallales bacterium]